MSDWTAYAAGLIIFGGCYLAIFQDDIKARRKAKQATKEAEYTQHFKPITKPKPTKKAPEKPKKPGPSQETIEAMHKQADAERAIAEALERKAQHITDPVKRARISKQAANSWLRFNKILDQIDKLTASD